MKRLFYFTGYRLSVLHWKGRALVGSSSFEPTESGLDSFRNYLRQTENIPGKFLVDVIEEDFRNEKIPHVGSKDRSSVINRLIDRYYRSSQDYCYSEIIGRVKDGRKDDIVLIGAMTNPQLIQPWLSVLDECDVPLSGIWTLPLISKKLLKIIKATNGVVLLVSQQVNSNVRQTLFRDGKLISSRQSIINQDMSDISGIGKLAAPEVNRTMEFLRAQNLVGSDEVINMHILGSNEQLQSLQQSFESDGRQSVIIHPIAEVQNKLGLKGVAEKFSDNIFAWLCVSQSLSASHYGERQSFNRYYNRLAATALYVASLLAVIAGVLITESNISAALEYEKSIELLAQEEKNYKALYAKKFKDFEEVFQNAGVMNSAVELAEQIKINSATSPLDFLINLSNVISQEELGTVHIDKIEWQAVSVNEKKGSFNKLAAKANFTAKLPVRHSAIVTGRINQSEHNYRESIEQIQAIIYSLKSNAIIENVEVIIMPVDLRSESKFSTESGVEIKQGNKKQLSGVFSLRIIMKAPDHA
ncbi:MAG: hypothetical protein ACNYZG_04835 [Gammaproteobacteria bacterium]